MASRLSGAGRDYQERTESELKRSRLIRDVQIRLEMLEKGFEIFTGDSRFSRAT